MVVVLIVGCTVLVDISIEIRHHTKIVLAMACITICLSGSTTKYGGDTRSSCCIKGTHHLLNERMRGASHHIAVYHVTRMRFHAYGVG